MLTCLLRLIFCIIISIISGFFYIWELSGNFKRKNKLIFLSVSLMLTYAGLFIPIYEDKEELFDILQMVSEFIIILIAFDGGFIKKLLVYLKMNIFMGIGTVAGLTYVFFVYGDIKKEIYSENTGSQIIFYVTVIAVFGILCSVNKYLRNKTEQTEEKLFGNLGGIELSVCVLAGMLCLIYSVGMMLSDSDNNIELIVLYLFLTGIILTVIILLNINLHITKRENLEKKIYVLKKLKEDGIKLTDNLEKEEKHFEEYIGILNTGLNRMYLQAEEMYNNSGEDIIKTAINEKIKKAEKFGIKIKVKQDIGKELYMKPVDSVSIISNLFDNAIEAVINQGNTGGYIKGEIKADKEDFLCVMENTYNGNIVVNDEVIVTTKKDKEKHGIGIRNVKEIVKRYGKNINIQAENGVFKVEIK